MQESIHELLMELEAEILEKVPLEKWRNAPEAIRVCAAIMMRCLRQLLEVMAEVFSEAVFRAKDERRKAGLICHDRSRPARTILTSVGVVRLRSDVYRDRESGRQISVLNAFMGFRTGQKTDEDVRRSVLEYLPFFSYKTSIFLGAGGDLSEKSVRRYLREYRIPEMEELEEKKKCPVLYVHIDEAHASVQKKTVKRRHSRQIPVAVVCEGMEEERKNRNRTICPYCIVDENCSTKGLENRIAAYILRTYDIQYLEQICVIGDGASSICTALDDWFPGLVRHYMDKFHIKKWLRRLDRAFKGKGQKPSRKLIEAMEKKDRAAAEKKLKALEKRADTDRQKKALDEVGSYIMKFWESITATMENGSPHSCTEAAVWHVLARRFTSDCISWSRENMGKLGALRAFALNGGSIREQRPGGQETYTEFLDRILTLPEHLNWEIFDPIVPAPDYDSGTQHLLRKIQSGGQLFGSQSRFRAV